MEYDKNDKVITNSIDIMAKEVVKYLSEHKKKIALAESCTGGMISQCLTAVSGASEVYELGVCSYSNRIKNKLLGVKTDTLASYGAVSRQTAEEMALGVLELSGSDIAAAVTGIAGPDGGTKEKPVGTVWVCVADQKRKEAKNLMLYNRGERLDRQRIRWLTTYEAFKMIVKTLGIKQELRDKLCQ